MIKKFPNNYEQYIQVYLTELEFSRTCYMPLPVLRIIQKVSIQF